MESDHVQCHDSRDANLLQLHQKALKAWLLKTAVSSEASSASVFTR